MTGSSEDFLMRWRDYTRQMAEEPLNLGYTLSSENALRMLLQDYYPQVLRQLDTIKESPDCMAKVLYTLAHLDATFVSERPEILQFVATSLTHAHPFVQYLAVNAFEQWRGQTAQCALLTFLGDAPPWLTEYVRQVLWELEEEISSHDSSDSTSI
ncbi:hypothetical protein [Sulfobacillus thermosulfidooxidans]|uniref:hypothetical protein n=1 Tax=Sulfobacillus thermosulfidooxidans TaxID=28034 RepID=UPI0006B4162F|nr:hypothetical protein [Sulfobacillus thermosulfidooxidans]